jgi:hypothetical protein
VTAAALAAGLFVVRASFGIKPAVAVAIAFAMRLGLRALAIVKQLSSPYIPRLKRTYEGRLNRPASQQERDPQRQAPKCGLRSAFSPA